MILKVKKKVTEFKVCWEEIKVKLCERHFTFNQALIFISETLLMGIPDLRLARLMSFKKKLIKAVS